MSKTSLLRYHCGLFAAVLLGCTPTAQKLPTTLSPDTEAGAFSAPLQLPDKLAESSGLVCLPEHEFLTINDSGNAAEVYRFNRSGKIIQQLQIPATNNDWEALTLHQNQLIIADTGNNAGQRNNINLLAIPFENGDLLPDATKKFSYHYKGMAGPVKPYEHELDAEAIASDGKHLWLFSKNWLGNTSAVYRIDLSSAATELVREHTIAAIPGVITDAAYAKEQKIFVLTGYRNVVKETMAFMLSRDYQPFILLTDEKFRPLKLQYLKDAAQVEAVCINNNQIWLSQESSRVDNARFWYFGTIDEVLRP